MLAGIKIENIAIIELCEFDLSRGLNCLTGETGAGKSIVIDAINCLMGEKTSRELIRTGSRSARVTARFEDVSKNASAILSEMGVDSESDGTLLISRTIFADGRNVCRVNGESVTLSMLKRLGHELISILGQNDSRDLLLSEKHIEYIDAIASNEAQREAYFKAYSEVMRLSDEIDSLSMDESEKLRRADILRYQIDEITKASLKPGERDELNARKTVILNSQQIFELLEQARISLDGDDDSASAAALSFAAADCLEKAGEFMPDAVEMSNAVRDAAYTLREYAQQATQRLRDISFSEEELDRIEQRLEKIENLVKKYGGNEENVLLTLNRSVEELEKIDSNAQLLEKLTAEFEEKLKIAKKLARVLSETRRAAADDFSRQVKEQLVFLDMPAIEFTVDRKPTALTPSGIDSMEFLISANVGEEPKPLAKIASGGELSRIMLSIKNVLSDRDNIDTLIFDEIDTGVSGRAAGKIALKLKQTARARQLICVTHLAQIAAFADSHFYIEKSFSQDRTYTKLTLLDKQGRINELARITGGLEITKTQLDNAQEMLETAQNMGGKVI